MIVVVISSNGFFSNELKKTQSIIHLDWVFYLYSIFIYFSTNPIAIEVEDCSETKTSLFS